LKKELKISNYSIVSEPGSETLILRVAITNLEPFQPLVRMHATITEATIWGGASAEAELIDALTGEVVAAVIDLQKGRVYNKFSKYGLVEEGYRALVQAAHHSHGLSSQKGPFIQIYAEYD